MDAVTPAGLAQVQRYLLPTERVVITTRRHWAVLAGPFTLALAALVVAVLIDVKMPPGVPLIRDVAWLGAVAVWLRFLWKWLERWADWFVVTDERLLLTYGLLTRKVAIMPLVKVTDMSYNVTLTGRALRYGEFVFESAGQDQALRRVGYLGNSALLFAVLSDELFGPDGIASSQLRRRRPPHWDAGGPPESTGRPDTAEQPVITDQPSITDRPGITDLGSPPYGGPPARF